jgi:hypothetical protein
LSAEAAEPVKTSKLVKLTPLTPLTRYRARAIKAAIRETAVHI